MTELADEIDRLVQQCLATGHLDATDAAAVRQHLADGDTVAASAVLQEAIDPYAATEGPTAAVPTVSTAAAGDAGD